MLVLSSDAGRCVLELESFGFWARVEGRGSEVGINVGSCLVMQSRLRDGDGKSVI